MLRHGGSWRIERYVSLFRTEWAKHKLHTQQNHIEMMCPHWGEAEDQELFQFAIAFTHPAIILTESGEQTVPFGHVGHKEAGSWRDQVRRCRRFDDVYVFLEVQVHLPIQVAYGPFARTALFRIIQPDSQARKLDARTWQQDLLSKNIITSSSRSGSSCIVLISSSSLPHATRSTGTLVSAS